VTYDRSIILNSFTPSHVIDDPDLFSGRRSQILELVDAFHTLGSCPLIFGDRGLGKTSLAIQGQLIAIGVNDLLNRIDAGQRAISETDTFLSFYVACSDDVVDTDGVIQLLVNVAGQVDSDESKGKRAAQLVNRQTSHKISLKFYELQVTRTYEREFSQIREEDLSPTERLARITRALSKHYGQPVLFIIDELDRVKDTRGLASLLRNLSSNQLKFLLVGVAQSVTELNFDHASIERALVPIKVPRMGKGELADIVDRAVERMNASGAPISFSARARSRLVQVAGGFPWFVHVIGQRALITAMDARRPTIKEDDVTRAIQDLTKNRFAQRFSDIYQQCVRDSMQREIVLRAFASWPGVDIPTGEIYAVLRQLGVRNPAIYKGHLTSPTYGAILVAPPYQQRGLVRFRDEMFKRYVFLRPSLYEDIDKKVEGVARLFEPT
jgi:Cdc6-like AAA superfamily ATPase